MGWSFTFGPGLFTLQFQGLGEHPFSSHPQLLLLSQLSIIVAFYASSALTMVNLSVPQETAAWFIVMAFTFLIRDAGSMASSGTKRECSKDDGDIEEGMGELNGFCLCSKWLGCLCPKWFSGCCTRTSRGSTANYFG
ncbi:hypothetical protein AMTR_s00039p00156150 [Amborella trichopoda]|uniref:Uncharacterized protein n=1 Tax=Amborella trichopoda TaxID=13333 RepID=U5D064_AMBTC|nr:hypothetical protein AMTR_s00039p00156150 [Amborella trichopoda]